jgi:adenine-specific DNA-methyltransferase
MHYVCRLEEVASMRQVMYTILQGFLSEVGKNDLAELGMDKLFDYPKPVGLIKILLDTILNKKSVVLDFFAGSGTTGQAVLELNEEDEGSRQVILVTNDENKIMTDVLLPRMEKVTKGYKTYKGLGNSFKYYKTAFVGENNIFNANDKDKVQLAHHAGELLAIAENTLEQTEKNDYWQIFENKSQITAVYFREEQDQFGDFVEKVILFKKPIVVYVFSWQERIEIIEFEDNKDIIPKTIPQPILEIYKQIYNLI